MKQGLILSNLIISALFLIIAILSLKGKIHFGHGIGDIVYAGIAALAFVLQTIFTITFYLSNKASTSKFRLLLVIFSVILLYLIYHFTLERGPES